jgi:hypothetical protein
MLTPLQQLLSERPEISSLLERGQAVRAPKWYSTAPAHPLSAITKLHHAPTINYNHPPPTRQYRPKPPFEAQWAAHAVDYELSNRAVIM